MIKLQSINLKKDNSQILQDINLEVKEKRIGIIGRNGSGKSSLIRLLNGIERPTSGHLEIDHIDGASQPDQLRNHVGFVFQNPDHQIVYPNVLEDLEFGLKNSTLSKLEKRSRIEKYCKQFQIIDLLERLTHTLSGGEKQLIALIGVLVMEPSYIVLDEPTTLLDLANKHRFMKILSTLPQTIIMVTHDLNFLESFERIILIEKGQIHKDGPPHHVIPYYKENSLEFANKVFANRVFADREFTKKH